MVGHGSRVNSNFEEGLLLFLGILEPTYNNLFGYQSPDTTFNVGKLL